jgi:hypothetical protein
MSKDLCQANSTAVGSDGIAPEGALQSNDSAEPQTIQQRDHAQAVADKLSDAIASYFGEDIGEHTSHNCPWTNALELIHSTPKGQLAERPMVGVFATLTPEQQAGALAYDGPEYIGLSDDAVCRGCGKHEWPEEDGWVRPWLNFGKDGVWHSTCWFSAQKSPNAKLVAMYGDYLAANAQSQIEEPQRGDTGTAEQREAGLTQKFKSKAQEIADRSMNQPVELVTAISSALSTAYEEGKASISQHVDAAVRAEREALNRWRNDCGILLAQIDYLTEATGEHLDCQDAGLVEQIRTDYRAAIRSRGNANG